MKIRLKSGFKSRLREHFDSQNCVHNFHSQAKFSLNLFFSEKFSLKQKNLVQVFNFRNFKSFFKEFKREYLNPMRSYTVHYSEEFLLLFFKRHHSIFYYCFECPSRFWLKLRGVSTYQKKLNVKTFSRNLTSLLMIQNSSSQI